MFALKPRTELWIRVSLVAAVLFNALMPTSTLAKSSPESAYAQAKSSGLFQVADCQPDVNGDLTIESGATCSLEAGSYTLNSISVSGTLLIKGNSTLNQGVTINAANVIVETGGKIDASGAGYVSSAGWVDGSGPGGGKRAGEGGGGGAGYGGNGQSWVGSGGIAYGSVTNPIDLGSSGGAGRDYYSRTMIGGSGGGALHLNISGILTVNGEIAADGNPAPDTPYNYTGGGGSGGSIWIDAETLAGSGSIHANGGSSPRGGGGGGGRVAVFYTTNTLVADWQHMYARGGKGAGPGTVYLKDTSSGPEKLLIHNGGNTTTTFAVLPAGTYSYDQIEVSGKGVLRILGLSSSLTINNQTIIGDGTGRMEVEGVVHGPQDFTLTNATLAILGDFVNSQTISLSGSGKLELFASSSLNNGIYTFTDVTVGNGATLKLVSYSNGNTDYTDDRGIVINAANLIVETGGTIDASGTGYVTPAGWVDGSGPGGGKLAGEVGAGGAGYGGNGQDSAGSGGLAYGSLTNPIDLGSSGGARRDYYSRIYVGGSGGGAIHLNVTESLIVNGEIAADGTNGDWGGGGGSGGSIWIETNILTGTGIIHANGGGNDGGGKGAGGRIAIYAEDSNHTITSSAQGGPGYEITGKGTVYLGIIDPVKSSVNIVPSQLTADGTSSATLTVTLRNAQDLPISDKAVKVSIVSGDGLKINGDAVGVNGYYPIGATDTNGVVTATLTTNTSGERTISAQAGQETIVEQAVVNFLPGNISAAVSRLQVDPSQVPANGSMPSQITVTVLDENNNPIPDAVVTLQASGSNAAVTQPANPTDSQGRATGQVVNSVVETVTITASADSGAGNVELTDTENVTFKGADLSIAMVAPPEAPAGTDVQYPYTITVNNSNFLAAPDTTIELILPSGITYLRDTSNLPKTQNGQTLSWNAGMLGPGGRLSFTVYGKISSTLPIGTSLSTQATVAASSAEDSLTNNSATVNTSLVNGYSFDASLSPANNTLAVGATGNYEITIRNTGLLPDVFDVSVVGLDSGQYALSQTSLTLSPQETGRVILSVYINSCEAQGTHPFDVNVVSQSQNTNLALSATAIFQAAPILTDLQPGSGTTIGSRDVTISWHTDAATTGLLTVYPASEPEKSRTYQTPEGTSHSVVIPTDDPSEWSGKNTFSWAVTATSPCGATNSTVNQFTISDGVVFQNHAQYYEINRDYDQTAQVTVINKGNKTREVQVSIEHAYDDLIINFRGSGSVDEKVTLLPGQSRTIELAVYAQDAMLIDQDYVLNAILTATDGVDTITDLATIKVRVLFEANYTITKISTDALNVSTYRITNLGQSITDLDIKAVDRITRLPASVYITPQIQHARVGAGESLDFRVIPLYYEQGLGPLGSSPSLKVLASPKQQSSTDEIDIESKVGNDVRYHQADLSCSAGKNLYSVTLSDVVMEIPISAYYCLNTGRLTVDVTLPPFMNANNITGAMLSLNLAPPAEGTGSYDLYINVNGHNVLSVDDAKPQGTYSFPIDKTYLNAGSFRGVTNTIEFRSEIQNPVHDYIGKGGTLYIALDEATVFVCASSQAEADQLAMDVYGFVDLPETFNVDITKPLASGAELEEDGSINVRAFVDDSASIYTNFYRVEAEVEYLDVLLEPKERFLLFDDGFNAHGDQTINDRLFNALWTPKHGGNVRLTLTATMPDGRVDTDEMTFNIAALPDLAVTKVFIEEVAFLNNTARVRAEITNLGFTITEPVNVDFVYYLTNYNGNKIGEPIHISHLQILDGLFESLERGETIEIEDTEFIPDALSLYYVEVIVDPDQ